MSLGIAFVLAAGHPGLAGRVSMDLTPCRSMAGVALRILLVGGPMSDAAAIAVAMAITASQMPKCSILLMVLLRLQTCHEMSFFG